MPMKSPPHPGRSLKNACLDAVGLNFAEGSRIDGWASGKSLGLVLILVVTAFESFGAPDSTPPSPVEIHEKLHPRCLEAIGEAPLDNSGGDIVWRVSYLLDSYLDLFLATGEEIHLDRFVTMTDRVLAARADRTGVRDYKGRLTLGWPTGRQYTQGGPEILPDAEGEPSLQVETIAHSGNHLTTVEILAAEDGSAFTLEAVNTANPDRPVRKTWPDLTMETVEAVVNPPLGESGSIRVKRLGDRIPASKAPFTPEIQSITLHGHHTGRILTPIARFAALILKDGGPPRFEAKAREYLADAEETMREHDRDFTEDGDSGYTIFEKGAPIWCDGVPEPHNTIAASGSAYLHLYRAGGNPSHLDKATRIARLIHRHHQKQDDGTWLFHYWWGPIETGWEPEDDISLNTPKWKGQKTVENISHFMLTSLFILDCLEQRVVFTEEDLLGWARNFKERIHREDDEGPWLTQLTNGDNPGDVRGRNNQVIYGFIELGGLLDPEVYQKCRAVYESRYLDDPHPTVLYGWAALALAGKRLSEKEQRTIER